MFKFWQVHAPVQLLHPTHIAHFITFTLFWFVLLIMADIGLYVGGLVTYFMLLHRGYRAAQVIALRPLTTNFFNAIRLAMLRLILGWSAIVCFLHPNSISIDAILLAVIFTGASFKATKFLRSFLHKDAYAPIEEKQFQ